VPALKSRVQFLHTSIGEPTEIRRFEPSRSGTTLARTKRRMELMPGIDDKPHAFPGVKLTYDDFVQFPDDGQRHELIDGEHYVTPSPNRKHQRVSGNIHLLIGAWLDPELDVVRVYQREGETFARPVELRSEAGDVLATTLLSGLELPLRRIFRA